MSFCSRRIVVTGLGIVSPIGCNVHDAWQNVLKGKSGVTKLNGDFDQLPCSIAAPVQHGSSPGEFDADKIMPKSEQRKVSDSILYAVAAANEALEDAHWQPQKESHLMRTGVSVGMGMADLKIINSTNENFRNKGYNKISPYFVPAILPNMAASHISLKYGFRGPNHSVSTACATGAHAVGDGYLLIKNGYADVMVCGGTDATLTPLSVAGFCRIKALCTQFNDQPLIASRPFDKQRSGFVMGEGAGIVILEEWEHACSRGAKAYAEILGYGMSADACHITAPREDGSGVKQCMQGALEHSVIANHHVGYVNAHATSTPLGDIAESKAIHECFGEIPVSSNKGNTGHMLGGSGSAEIIFTVLSCYTGILPHTANLQQVGEGFPPLEYIQHQPKEWKTDGKKIALSNSFGFGGTNASICISSI